LYFRSLFFHFNLTLSARFEHVVSGLVLKTFLTSVILVDEMPDSPNGKLLVYASSFASREKRLKSVNLAAEKIANLLKLSVEVVALKEEFTPIYVYYENGDGEPIPLYCNKCEESNPEKIYDALRNMMFVLSFHPKHSALRRIRKEIMRFS